MRTNWHKLGLFLVGVSGVYILLVGIIADFTQVISLKYGFRLLVLLLVASLGYKVWEQLRRFWLYYLQLITKLDEARNFIMRSGERSTIILLCAQARWLYHNQGQSIRVNEIQPEGIIILDVGKVLRKPNNNLLGMHFSFIGFEGGERAKGTVKLCSSSQACIELYEQAEMPEVGDLAIPLEPPQATELERLLGNILFILSE